MTKTPLHMVVNDHVYVHVAACPCYKREEVIADLTELAKKYDHLARKAADAGKDWGDYQDKALLLYSKAFGLRSTQ